MIAHFNPAAEAKPPHFIKEEELMYSEAADIAEDLYATEASSSSSSCASVSSDTLVQIPVAGDYMSDSDSDSDSYGAGTGESASDYED